VPSSLQAAKRRAIAELIFFAGTNDQRRCKQLAATWNIDVSGGQDIGGREEGWGRGKGGQGYIILLSGAVGLLM